MWEKDYLINPTEGLSLEQAKSLLGGEAAIWSDFVDASNIYSLIFPRLRFLFSNPRVIKTVYQKTVCEIYHMYPRMGLIVYH